MNVFIIVNQDIYIDGVTYGLKQINKNYNVYGVRSEDELSEGIEKLYLTSVIIDGDMKSLIILNIIKYITRFYPEIPIIFITENNGFYSIDYYKDFLISAVIKRNTPIDILHNVLLLSRLGIKCFSEDIIISNYANKSGKLSRRQEEVLKLVLDGLTNKQIAKNLNISPGTVKSHIETILLNMNVHSRIKAAIKYFKT